MTVDDVDQEASTGLGALISDNPDVELGSHQVLGDISERDIDDESGALGLEIISEIPTEHLIQSRVLKDPFHVFNMIYISKAHGLLYMLYVMQCSFLTRRTEIELVYFLPVLIPHRLRQFYCVIIPHSCGNIASELFLHQKSCIQWLQKLSILMGH